MPSECAHATCTNLLVKGNGISFHRFPKDHERRMRWTFLMRRSEGWHPKSWDLVCSSHFKDEDFDRTGQTVRLRHNVEPSVFNIPEHLRKTPKVRRTANSNRKRAASPDVHIADDCNSCVDEMDTAVQSFHTYAAPSEESYKEKWLRVDSRADDLERRLHNALQREKRTKLTALSLVEELKEKNMLTEDLQSRLDAYSDFPIHLFKKTTEYTNEQKNFAMTLHLYGPKAYDYLAKKVNLPSPRTLRRWLSKTDGTPGLNSTMLQALKDKVIKDPSTFTDVALMLDAMSIRRTPTFPKRSIMLVCAVLSFY